MVKEIFHGNMNSYFHVDSIAKILAARSDNGATAHGMMSQNHVISSLKNLFSFHSFQNDMTKMVRSSRILISAVIMSMLLDIK